MTSNAPASRWAAPAATLLCSTLLLLTLWLHLVGALFAGMLVFLIVDAASPWFGRSLSGHRQRVVATVALAVLVVGLLGLGLVAAVGTLSRPENGIEQLWAHLFATLQGGKDYLPPWITEQFPASADELRQLVLHWFNRHSAELGLVGKEAGLVFAQALVAMVIGAMVAIHAVDAPRALQPFSSAMVGHLQRFHAVFRDVVSAQLQIALINASLTAIFLALVLPALGIHLPLVKTLVLITAVVGMLPVIGNVISNTLIVLLSVSVSLPAAALSLVFLVALHKFEYFLNARIVGHRIDAQAWELLLAILVMESAFGLAGIAVAPIYYAYAKRSLASAGWI